MCSWNRQWDCDSNQEYCEYRNQELSTLHYCNLRLLGTLEVLQLTIVTPVSKGRFLIKEHCMVDFASVKQSIVNNSGGMKSPANWNSFEDKGIS